AVSFQPLLTIQNVDAGTSTGTALAGAGQQSVSGGGIQNVSGVMQGIQVAGNHNDIANDTHITITTDHLDGLPAGVVRDRSLTRSDPGSGSVLSARLSQQGVGVSITVPSLGQAVQRIQGGVAGAGLMQLAQTTGSLQQIRNITHLRVQVRSMDSLLP